MSWTSLLLALAAAAAPPDRITALKVGRAITVSGEDIAPATILIEGGKIAAIGSDVSVPPRAEVIALPRAVAMPGIVDVHTTAGLRVPNENMADVPFLSVLDGIDPSAPGLENLLRDGVVAAHVIPANATRLGGQGAVIRTRGRMVDDMVIRSPSAMKISLEPAAGDTRMGNMAALRRTFYALYERLEAIQNAEKPRPISAPSKEELASILAMRPPWNKLDWAAIPGEKIPERDRPLVDLVRGRLPAFIYCPRAGDVFKALELMDTQGIRGTLVLGRDAWKLESFLRARRDRIGPVVLDAELEYWEEDPETGDETLRNNALAVMRAGVPFALQARLDRRFHRGPYFGRDGAYHLWYQAARLVSYGIPRRTALEAITRVPARILGLEDRLGTLEKGKDASIAVFSGDPLDARSWVELVLIEGEVAYRKDKDPDLELLLRRPVRPF